MINGTLKIEVEMVDGAELPFAEGDSLIYFERKHSLLKSVGLLDSGNNNVKK